MIRHSIGIALVVPLSALAAAQGPAPGGKGEPPRAAVDEPLPPARLGEQPAGEVFGDRLRALTPAHPEEYFLLGEEVADLSHTPEYRTLAATLFVLAFQLDLDSHGAARGRIAASACLALADVTRDSRDSRWLAALASTLLPALERPDWVKPAPPSSVDAEGYQVATIMGLVRSGEGGRARQLLSKPEVKAAFWRQDALLSRLGLGGASAIAREAERWPCSECGNRRVSRRARAETPESALCFHCEGNPGPKLTRDQLLSQLRFESWMLRGRQRSWAAQAIADGGTPLQDPDPAGVAPIFGVDARAVYWRDGRWWQHPDGTSDPTPPPEAPAPADEKPKAPATTAGN